MTQPLLIKSVRSKIHWPKTQLEKHVNRHHTRSLRIADVPLPGYEDIAWSFTHIPVKGHLEIVFANNRTGETMSVDVPASAGFLAGCTKRNKGNFELAVGLSLS